MSRFSADLPPLRPDHPRLDCTGRAVSAQARKRGLMIYVGSESVRSDMGLS